MKQIEYKYDAFISHAVEDKIPIANELCNRLEKEGLEIWYSGKVLGPGDSISRTIEEGLQNSRFGIVVFTRTYISKAYALKELFELLEREKTGRKIILPVLHEIAPSEIASKGLEMEDRFQISTERGLDYVVKKLVDEIRKPDNKIQEPVIDPGESKRWIKYLIGSVIGILVTAMVSLGIYQEWFTGNSEIKETFITESINNRIQSLDKLVDNDYKLAMNSNSGKVVDSKAIEAVYTNFKNFKSYYRNAYELNNGNKTIVSKKNVDAKLRLDLGTLTPFNSYSFTSPEVSLIYEKDEETGKSFQYTYSNNQPVSYTFSGRKIDDNSYTVNVKYSNNIRYIKTSLSLPNSSSEIKRHQMYIIALVPEEQFEFEMSEGVWKLSEID